MLHGGQRTHDCLVFFLVMLMYLLVAFFRQEIQLHKLLLLTRMIAARLFQDKDGARALLLYNDVISTMLPVEELKKLEPVRNHTPY